MDYGIAWMETEPNGITQWKWTWHIMYGNGAEWHHIMELDMEYYGWKRSQACIFPTGCFWSPHSLGMVLE